MDTRTEIINFLKDKNKEDYAYFISLIIQGVYKDEFNKFITPDGTIYEMHVDILETKE